MSRRMTYLHKHPRNGGYWFRRGIPVRIQPIVGKGQTWSENLKTKDLREARARIVPVISRVDRAFEQAEAQLTGISQPIQESSAFEVISAIAKWKNAEINRRANAQMSRFIMPREDFDHELYLIGAEGYGPEDLYESGDIVDASPSARREFFAWERANDDFVEKLLAEIVAAYGLVIDRASDTRSTALHLIRDAWADAVKAEERFQDADYSGLPPLQEAVSEPRHAPTKSISTAPLISESFEVWATGGGVRGAKRPTDRTVIEARTSLRRFVELHGDLPIDMITKGHGREFRDALARLPSGLPKAVLSQPITNILNMDLSGYRQRSATTTNKLLNLLGAVLTRAEQDGHFDNGRYSRPLSLQLLTNDRDEANYQPFTTTEIKRLIASPVFSIGDRPVRGRGDTAKWAPLFALFQGARRAEVLQLYVRDIFADDDTGIWVAQINRDAGKSLKTASSVRTVPLHPTLLSMGFPAFVEARRREAGEAGSLWPGFEDREKLHNTINRWGEWFSRYLAAHVVSDPQKKFHSFRATYKRFGRAADVPMDILDRSVGHGDRSVSGRYGQVREVDGSRDTGYPLKTIFQHISSISFGDVDFTLVK